MKSFLLLFLVTLLPLYPFTPLSAQSALENELRELVTGFKGDVGIYVEHLQTGETISIQADSLFPSASMVKVPIMAGIFQKLEAGELTYDGAQVYDSTRYYPGSDVTGNLRSGSEISLHKLLFLMLSFSDNTASLWLQELAGTGTEINTLMDELGLPDTKVNSRTPGRQEDQRQYGWGVTSPRQMATFLKKIRAGEVVSEAASEEMYRLLTKTLWDKEAISQLPPYVNVASKQGAVNRSRSEVLLVSGPDGDYVLCFITKNQEDMSWNADNEGWVLLRAVSKAVWSHYAPSDDWKPKEGASRYQ